MASDSFRFFSAKKPKLFVFLSKNIQRVFGVIAANVHVVVNVGVVVNVAVDVDVGISTFE